MSIKPFVSFVFACVAVTALVTVSALAVDPAIKCESGKLKEAGKYTGCVLSVDSKAVKRGLSPDYSKCESRFTAKWNKIELKGAGLCPSSGDDLLVKTEADTFASSIRSLLEPHASPAAVAVGGKHTCAILDNGAVRCWGDGGYGQLGYGNVNDIGDDEEPASAGDVNVGGTVVQLAAGFSHTCAQLDSGAVRCWGVGGAGQLGYGNEDDIGDNEEPASAGDVNVEGGNALTVVQLVTGGWHNCALLDNGAVRCWGDGGYGRLGYGNVNDIGDNEEPASAGDVNVGGTVVQLAAGFTHTCALLDTGAVRCWGYGFYGNLGYGNNDTIGNNEDPASAGDVNVGGTVVQLAAGGQHTCALMNTGAVRCWGYGFYGQLGYGNTTNVGDSMDPASAGDVNVGGPVVQLAAGDRHTCALLYTGAIRCWGYGASGRLGYGNTDSIGDNEDPASAGDVPYQ